MGINNRYKHVSKDTANRQRQRDPAFQTARQRFSGRRLAGQCDSLFENNAFSKQNAIPEDLPVDSDLLNLPKPVFSRKRLTQQTLKVSKKANNVTNIF